VKGWSINGDLQNKWNFGGDDRVGVVRLSRCRSYEIKWSHIIYSSTYLLMGTLRNSIAFAVMLNSFPLRNATFAIPHLTSVPSSH
jgi:hypothetical protein